MHASSASSLVKSNQGSDVYNVSGAQLQAATNPGDLHETVYQYAAVTPGVTSTGFPGQPRVRGGQVTDLGYEYDGIPIEDRITGFFTSNLSNIGVSNLEVYTGGLSAADATNGTGFLNSVVKTGTYPGFTNLFVQATSPEFNNFLTFEHGGATANHRFSYYVGLDAVNSQNQYDYGEHSYPAVMFWGYNGPGPVKTRDWVGNFHYRPTSKDDIQFLITNSLGEFNYNYLINKAPGEPPALGFVPCQGATANSGTMTGASGGTAPNGQPCPEGLAWGAQSAGGGNIWHHYGGLGKLQWNHNINDHSFLDFRVAENFNQYIFDQPIGEANIPGLENAGGGWNWASDVLGLPATACPSYPYAAGSPVAMPAGDPGDICAFDDGIQNFWGDRRSNMYFANFDYVNTLNEKVTLKAGASDERDNVFNYYLTNAFATLPDGSIKWPAIDEISSYPTNRQSAYAEADVHVGKFLLDPGLNWSQMHYGFPADYGSTHTGGETERILTPTFNGTYTFDPNDVLRFSYGNTASFISSTYVYTSSLSRHSNQRNPFAPGTTYQPQINHSWDLMWEHAFGDGTSLRVGPYFNKTSNYFEEYTPIVGYISPGVPRFAKQSVLSNNQEHQTFGAEFALNHVNNRAKGWSYWLSGTYNNYWSTTGSLSGAFINYPLPQNIIDAGNLVRSSDNPLISATLVADYHSGRFHFNPLVYYQGDTFFNTADVVRSDANGNPITPYIASNRQIASGYWKASMTLYEALGVKRNVIAGLKVDNLFDNTNDVFPCSSFGTGCFPFNGPQSGVVNQTGSIYQNYTQSPRTIYFFAGVKL
ncbi:MAG: hypothetical protein ACXWNP_14925 [Vulcanimicrobiaceae bacterium]